MSRTRAFDSLFLKEKELWLLIALGIAFFSKPLFFGQTFFFGDLFFYFLPEKKLIGSLIRSGEFPLWNPFLYGGQPFLANLNNGVLYPTSLLYAILPPLTAFNIDIVFHLIFCSVSCYLLARAIGFSKIPSLVAGLIFGFCGYTLSHGNLFNRLLALPYLPLALFFWHRAITTRNRKWSVFTAGAVTIQFFAGAPETTILTLGALFFWICFYPTEGKSLRKNLLLAFCLCVLLAGLTAIQSLPTAELVLQSPREKFNRYEVFTDFSLNPRRLPELVLPAFLGRIGDLQNYWGKSMEDHGSLFISNIYFGWLVVFLLVYAAFNTNANEILSQRFRMALFGIFLFSLLLSLGRFLPGFPVLFHVPVVKWFRYPIKFLTAGLIPAALLTAAAVEHLFSNASWKPPRRFLYIYWLLFSLLCASFLLFPHRVFFKVINRQIANGIRESFIHAILISVLAGLFFQLAQRKSLKRGSWFLAAIITIDLLWAGSAVNPYIERTIFFQKYPIVERVKKEINGGRLYRPATGPVKILAPSPRIVYGIQWELATLNSYTNTFYEIPSIYNVTLEALETWRLLNARLKVSSLPWERKIPFLSAAAVSVVLTPEQINVSQLPQIERIETNSNLSFALYKNQNAVSKIKFYSSGAIVRSPSQALEVMEKPGFDVQNFVVLEGVKRPEGKCVQSAVKIRKVGKRSDSGLYEVENSCNGYFYFSEPYYKGWTVKIDGTPSEIIPANGAFFAVRLPAGKHMVSIRYLPQSVIAGGLISTFSLVSILIWLSGWWMRKPASSLRPK